MRYLRLKAQSLTDREKYVVLQIDEIGLRVMQSLQYQGGRITGVAENATTEQANSIQAFLIASMAGSLREIVSLVPVKQLTAGNLKDMIMKVISVVQACGYVVVVLASDNNQINARAFEDLCSGTDMCAGFRNPDFPDSTVFVVFDTGYRCFSCCRLNNVAVPLLLTPVCPVAQPPTIQHKTAKASVACQ